MIRRSRVALLALVLAALVLAALGAGCGGTDAPDPPEAARPVEIPGPDGTRLAGTELGRGPVGVVLAHGATTNMASWYAPMEAIADAGYRVLAFDARGVGDSTGPASTDPQARMEDIEAAVTYLRRSGAARVVVMGSSLGSQAALLATAKDRDVTAVVGVSPGTIPDGLDAIAGVPAFFVASEGDAGPAQTARELGRRFGRPAKIVTGSIHGSDLFADHPEATRALVAFLTRVVPVRN